MSKINELVKEEESENMEFKNNWRTEENLGKMGLNERQVKAVMYVREKRKITNKEYREMFGITDRTALRDLTAICEEGIFQKVGITGRKTEYTLIRQKPDKPDINPTKTRHSSDDRATNR
jgi:ATP-dependent DNA helicase RecG